MGQNRFDRKDNLAAKFLPVSRRGFCRLVGATGGLAAAGGFGAAAEVVAGLGNAIALQPAERLSEVEARYYDKLEHNEIACRICPRECQVGDLERGYCGTRENRGGIYYTLVYGLPCAAHIDPIEKKPLFHFLPGKLAFSIATAGCNVNCKFCQNWDISQFRPEQTQNIDLPPEKVVEYAVQENAPIIAYTYSEPVVFYEYMYDTAKLGRQRGIRSVMITGGHINQKPLIDLCGQLDAIKVDLKAFSESYYRDIVHGELKPVLDALVTIQQQKLWLEIVYLVVPTLNDSEKEFTELCAWIMANLGPDVPIHFTRFHPTYLLKNLPPTPVSTLETAIRIADAAGLKYVYIGNVPGHLRETTFCGSCGNKVIGRYGFQITGFFLQDGLCKYCGNPIPGVWV
jgi:pyruvate formate lyase activating enzyme